MFHILKALLIMEKVFLVLRALKLIFAIFIYSYMQQYLTLKNCDDFDNLGNF